MIYKTHKQSDCGGKRHEMRQTENFLDVENVRRKVLSCTLYNRYPESEVMPSQLKYFKPSFEGFFTIIMLQNINTKINIQKC